MGFLVEHIHTLSPEYRFKAVLEHDSTYTGTYTKHTASPSYIGSYLVTWNEQRHSPYNPGKIWD
jgi:hypothetical protein